jgi:hypothetical protein
MSSGGFGQGPKKETVYSGPVPGSQGTVYGGPTTNTTEGTVYNGPGSGSVYQGPTSASGYGPAMQSVRQGTPSVNAGARKGAGIFFVISAFTALRTILLFAGVQQLTLGANRIAEGDIQLILIINVVVIAIFVTLGVLTKRGSKTALLIGMLLYGADLVLLLVSNAGANVIYIVVHGLFLFYLFNAYRQFTD